MRKILMTTTLMMMFAFTTVNAEERTLTPIEKAAFIKVIKARLRDPNSAQFSWVPMIRKNVYCGYVNAKNSYGGYVGFVQYYGFLAINKYTKKPIALIIAMSNGSYKSVLSKTVRQSCAKEGYQ